MGFVFLIGSDLPQLNMLILDFVHTQPKSLPLEKAIGFWLSSPIPCKVGTKRFASTLPGQGGAL